MVKSRDSIGSHPQTKTMQPFNRAILIAMVICYSAPASCLLYSSSMSIDWMVCIILRSRGAGHVLDSLPILKTALLVSAYLIAYDMPFAMSLNHGAYILTPRFVHSRIGVSDGHVIPESSDSMTGVATHSCESFDYVNQTNHLLLQRLDFQTLVIPRSFPLSLFSSVDDLGSELAFHLPLLITLGVCLGVIFEMSSLRWGHMPGTHFLFSL